MTTLYQKTYGAIKENTTGFVNPEAALSFYLEGASKYLAKAAIAAREDRFEDRANLTQNALLIFYGIISYLDPIPPAEKQAVQSLIDYCHIINEVIFRMNAKNDPEIGENLSLEIKRMSEHWKQRSLDIAATAAASLTPTSPMPPPDLLNSSITMTRPGQGKSSIYQNGGTTSSYSA